MGKSKKKAAKKAAVKKAAVKKVAVKKSAKVKAKAKAKQVATGQVDDHGGVRGDDFVKYGSSGVFKAVADKMNEHYKPDAMPDTINAWEDYRDNVLGGDVTKHRFGRFAAHLIDFKAGLKNLPTYAEWDTDTKAPGGLTIQPEALSAVEKCIIDNLNGPSPKPMRMLVKKSGEMWHSIGIRQPADIFGEKGIEVTIFCPA